MRRIFFVAAVLAAFAPASALFADPPAQAGRLSFLAGPVSFHTDSFDEWAPATLNYPLTVGDHLWTDAGGRAEVQIASASIRLDSLGELSFDALDDQSVQARLSQGSLNVKLWSLDPGDLFEVDTPNARVTLVSNGSYRIDVQADGDTTVTVRQGQAQAETNAGTLAVMTGQSATVSGQESIAYYVVAAPGPDEWDRWCFARDAQIDRLAALQFLPRGMVGVEDLENHGTWITASAYGRVWAPTNVPAGWAPYRYGHWAWVAPWGWTWIDDAAWGFAPFHYGRWALLNSRWCWVPGAGTARPVYAPALVVFLGDVGQASADDIGWFPLAPGEVYVPPYAVDDSYLLRINVTIVPHITIQSIRTIQVERMSYANRAAHAVTVVPRQVFVTARPAAPAAVVVPGADFGRAKPMARPTFLPQRESYVGQATTRAPAPRPPAEVLSRKTFLPPGQAPRPGSTVVTPSPQTGNQQPPAAMRPPQAAGRVETPEQAQAAERPQTPPGRTQAPGQAQAAGKSEAASLIASVKQKLPAAQAQLASARKNSKLKYDFNAASQQLTAAQASLTNADRAYAAGNYAQATQAATAAQSQIQSVEDALATALRAAGSSDDKAQGGNPSQGNAGQQGGKPGNSQGGKQSTPFLPRK